MGALEQFVDWLGSYAFRDRNRKLPPGLRLQYHSRSDEHSKKLGELIVDDLLDECPKLCEQAARGEVAFSINHLHIWPNGKGKTIDLAFGIPVVRRPPPVGARIHRLTSQTALSRTGDQSFDRLLIACEEKAVMTEHGKSQPRVYSELNDSHTIVHKGGRDTIAVALTMLNIARRFISPLRQRPDKPIEISVHNQPHVTESMVQHLRRLPIRERMDQVGLDAYCTFVVDLDNQGHVALHTSPPAPQVGDQDHYETFLHRIAGLYAERFGDLASIPPSAGLSVEESLAKLAKDYPKLLSQSGQLAIDHHLDGALELRAIMESIERYAIVPDSGDRSS